MIKFTIYIVNLKSGSFRKIPLHFLVEVSYCICMREIAILLLVLVGCGTGPSRPTDLSEINATTAKQKVIDAWELHGLPELGACQAELSDLPVYRMVDSRFDRHCGSLSRYACVYMDHIVVAERSTRVEMLVQHESLHWLAACTGYRADMDPGHTDETLWVDIGLHLHEGK
jgi:hypothetical protein